MMNQKELKLRRKPDLFFFENKIYEFSQKRLNESDRQYMKAMTKENEVAKRKLASALMALEYVEGLSQSGFLQVDKAKHIKAYKKRYWYLHLTLGIGFTGLLLASIFFLLKIFFQSGPS